MTEPNRQKYDPSTWVDEHGDALFRFALLRVKDETVAEDLVQETLLSALKGIDRFKGGSSLRTWLVGILKHKIIDQYRRNRPEVLSSDLASEDGESGEERLERSRDEGAPLISTWTDSPGKLLENKEFWQIFLRCLDGLTENHRRAFVMREIDGITGDAICKILDITPTNLWVILHRARAKLRGCLEANWFSAK